MSRNVEVSWPGETIPPLEVMTAMPESLLLQPAAPGEADSTVLVTEGEHVQRGQPLIDTATAITHAPLPGIVTALNGTTIRLDVDPQVLGSERPENGPLPRHHDRTINADFLKQIGLVGMGGSMFPASRKLAACTGVHTVIINAVECEPGITIDQALLLAETDAIRLGASAVAAAVGADKVVLAVQRNGRLVTSCRERYDNDLVLMPTTYPAGAERLIVRKLARRQLAPGELPFHAGFLVHNVATLRALGRALADGLPVIERPLSVISPDDSVYRNMTVPIGVPIGHLLQHVGISCDPEKQIVIAGGLMMGHETALDQAVTKGTTSVIVLNRDTVSWRETSCIRCGACNAACPLGLHPIGMVDRMQTRTPSSAKLRVQLESCFLCALCSAVCPSHIPLVKHLSEGKQWIRQPHQ